MKFALTYCLLDDRTRISHEGGSPGCEQDFHFEIWES